MNIWHELPYLATNNVIFTVLESWSPEWCTPAGSAVEAEKSAMQLKKEQVKLRMAQLAEKYRKEEVAVKAQPVHDAAKLVGEQQKQSAKEISGLHLSRRMIQCKVAWTRRQLPPR